MEITSEIYGNNKKESILLFPDGRVIGQLNAVDSFPVELFWIKELLYVANSALMRTWCLHWNVNFDQKSRTDADTVVLWYEQYRWDGVFFFPKEEVNLGTGIKKKLRACLQSPMSLYLWRKLNTFTLFFSVFKINLKACTFQWCKDHKTNPICIYHLKQIILINYAPREEVFMMNPPYKNKLKKEK